MLVWSLVRNITAPVPCHVPKGHRCPTIKDGTGEVPLWSTSTVSPHEGMAPDWVKHLNEIKWPHCDLTGTVHLETRLLVEGNQEVLTHENSTTNVGQAAEVLQIAPHQNGAFSLLTECPVDSQHVNVHSRSVRLMEIQGILRNREQQGDVSECLKPTERPKEASAIFCKFFKQKYDDKSRM